MPKVVKQKQTIHWEMQNGALLNKFQHQLTKYTKMYMGKPMEDLRSILLTNGCQGIAKNTPDENIYDKIPQLAFIFTKSKDYLVSRCVSGELHGSPALCPTCKRSPVTSIGYLKWECLDKSCNFTGKVNSRQWKREISPEWTMQFLKRLPAIRGRVLKDQMERDLKRVLELNIEH